MSLRLGTPRPIAVLDGGEHCGSRKGQPDASAYLSRKGSGPAGRDAVGKPIPKGGTASWRLERIEVNPTLTATRVFGSEPQRHGAVPSKESASRAGSFEKRTHGPQKAPCKHTANDGLLAKAKAVAPKVRPIAMPPQPEPRVWKGGDIPVQLDAPKSKDVGIECQSPGQVAECQCSYPQTVPKSVDKLSAGDKTEHQSTYSTLPHRPPPERHSKPGEKKSLHSPASVRRPQISAPHNPDDEWGSAKEISERGAVRMGRRKSDFQGGQLDFVFAIRADAMELLAKQPQVLTERIIQNA